MSEQAFARNRRVVITMPASLLPLEREQREDVVAAALAWERTPYHHEARVKGAGVDCAQFLYAVFVEDAQVLAPFTLPSYRPQYGLHRSDEVYLEWIQHYGRPVQQARPGDIVTYKFGRVVSHAAIVLDWPSIIHASYSSGVIRDDALKNVELRDHQKDIYRLAAWEDD